MIRLETPAAPTSPFANGRMSGIDALRSIAMLAGILLHSSVAYLSIQMGERLWPVQEAVTSNFCDMLYWGIHAFRLPVFFFLSGFFTEHLLQSRSAAKFLEHRIRRLVIPYAVAAGTILPLTFIVWTTGWLITGACDFNPAATLGFSRGPQLRVVVFNPGHLWFLLDLIVMTGAFFVLRQEFPTGKHPATNSHGWLVGPRLTPCLLAFAPTMILWGQTSPVTSFQNSFLVDAPRLVYFFTYFAAGTCAFRRREQFFETLRQPVWNLMCAALFVGTTLLTYRPEVGGTGGLINRLFFSGSVALAAWFTIFGAMGLVVRYSQTDRPSLRYLADSSYWMYLIHLPIVGLAQIALIPSTLPPVLKMLIVFSASVFVSLGSYAVFVRHSVIGYYLHGRRDRAASRLEVIQIEETATQRPEPLKRAA